MPPSLGSGAVNTLALMTATKGRTKPYPSLTMATQYEIEVIDELVDSATKTLTALPSLLIGAYCWWTGRTRVSGAQLKIANNLSYGIDHGDTTLEAITVEVGKCEDGTPARRIRRRRKLPYASFLVATLRGAHLEQCSRTESNVMMFGRHARSLMAKHGLRPTDAARVLPLAAALFFEHRSIDQIDGAAIPHAPSFKTSRVAFLAKYVSWGWADTFTGAA